MIQETVARCGGWIEPANTWVVTNDVQAAETRRQLPDVPDEQILIEPCARNTAPCLGLAAIHLLHADPDALMFVMPADHAISPIEAFQRAGRTAAAIVAADPSQFVLFGVPPAFPATGYGYIERGDALGDVPAGFKVASFREKPNREVAQQFVEAGSYYWNCGIFCWTASSLLAVMAEHEPDMHDRLQRVARAIGSGDYEATLATEFPGMNSISVDYAVLEKAGNVSVVEAPFEWDDVGSWLSLPRLLGADEKGNTIDGSFCGVRTEGSIVRTTDDHTVAMLGMQNCIVVHTPDATLIANRDDADAMRDLHQALRDQGLDHLL